METLTLDNERAAWPLSGSEEHDYAMAAFLGALDDIIIEASVVEYNADLAQSGGNLYEKVQGLFDSASRFYNEDMARNVALVNSLAMQLAEKSLTEGCLGHIHNQLLESTIGSTLGANNFAPTYSINNPEQIHNHSHEHNEDHDDDCDEEEGEAHTRNGKRNRK